MKRKYKAEDLKVKKYKKGDKIAGVYLTEIAGRDLYVANAYGIYADVFDRGKYYQVPNVRSKNKGSGKFLEFLLALKRGLDKPVYFCSITNQGIYKYLFKADIGIVESDGKKAVFRKVEYRTMLTLIEYKLKQ